MEKGLANIKKGFTLTQQIQQDMSKSNNNVLIRSQSEYNINKKENTQLARIKSVYDALNKQSFTTTTPNPGPGQSTTNSARSYLFRNAFKAVIPKTKSNNLSLYPTSKKKVIVEEFATGAIYLLSHIVYFL